MFWMARMENKGKIQHLFHVCFQGSIKCEKIICRGELGTTPSKKAGESRVKIQCV